MIGSEGDYVYENQLTFEDIKVRARTYDPTTSHEAAVALEAEQSRLHRAVDVVLELLKVQGPLADFEISPQFYEQVNGVPHLHKMARHWARQKGLVKDTGEKRVNPASNRKGIVWDLGEDKAFLSYELVRCSECGHVSRELKDPYLID